MNRTKSKGQQDLLVFPHHSSWMQCPLHALATMLVTDPAPETRLFPNVTGAVSYMNSLLKTLSVEALAQGSIPCYVTNAGVQTLTTEDLTEWLSSHSFRSGGAAIFSEHPDIQVHWIVPRGSWSLDTIQTVFRYIHATFQNDSRVARALAGWPDVDGGMNGIAMSSVKPYHRILLRGLITGDILNLVT